MKYLSLLLLSIIVLSLKAQEVKKNELSLDVLTFTRNTNIPGIIYKRRFDKGALRLKFNSTLFTREKTSLLPSTDTSFVSQTSTTNIEEGSSQFFIGYEWQTKVESKWTINYGIDLMIELSINSDKTTDVFKRANGTNGRVFIIDNEANGTKFGLSPFIGARYDINDRIFAGIESYVFFLSGSEELKTTIINNQAGVRATTSSTEEPSTFEYSLIPNTLITIGYTF